MSLSACMCLEGGILERWSMPIVAKSDGNEINTCHSVVLVFKGAWRSHLLVTYAIEDVSFQKSNCNKIYCYSL